MSTPERLLALLLLCAGAAFAQQSVTPLLGEPLDADAIAALERTVMADGRGLPPGRGDALTGAAVYATHCRVCHGERGRGGPNDALVGGRDTLDGPSPLRTIGSYWPYATTVFDYVRRAMPYQAPGSLSADEVYAVTAYLLYENGIIARDEEMNARSLPAVHMPNRDGFDWHWHE